MSEPTAAAKSLPLRAAALPALAVLLALAGLIPLMAMDHAEREKLETVSETTAVGDQAYLKHRTRGPMPEVFLHGKPLLPPSPRHLELRDSKMTFAGVEDGGTLRLYTTNEPVPWEKGEIEIKGEVYYMKIEPNLYLRVQAQ